MGSQTTLGVAVAIPQPHAGILTSWRRQVGDPAAELVFPHVTLLPPTAVRTDAMPEIEAHLRDAAAQVPSFDMHLAGTGTFRPTSPVVYIQIARGIAQCEQLESSIRRGCLERELDFPYHPHVTVAHRVDDAALDEAYDGLAGFVARFGVRSIVLFSQAVDGSWTWGTEFPLHPSDADRTE